MQHTNTQSEGRLRQILDEGFEFRTFDYVNEGIEIFKQNTGGFVLWLLAYLGIVIGSVATIIGIFALPFILPPLIVGPYIVARKIRYGGQYQFGDFFTGYNKIWALFLVQFIGGIFISIGISFFFLPGLFLAVAFSWGSLFVIFMNYEFWPALETSLKVISKNWFSVFGLMLIIGIINFAGVITLFGWLFTVPLSTCIMYAAFDDVVRPNEQSQEDEDLMQHFG